MNKASVYSPLKIVHHPLVLDDLRANINLAPVLVQLILSDFCNQDCSFCAYRMSGYTSNQNFGVISQDGSVDNNPKRMISREKAREILTDCQSMGVKSIEFTGGGEPTVHPNFAEIIAYTHDLGLDFSLVTNGVLLTEKVRDPLLNATWVRLSLDAGTSETYAKVRRVGPGMFTKALNNFEALISQRRYPEQVFGISFVVTHENWREILSALRCAKEVGADYFRIGACFTPDDETYYAGIYDEIRDVCIQAKGFETQNFTVFSQFQGRVGDLIQRSPNYDFCGHQHLNTYIGGDLNIYRCCALAYNDRGYLGSVKDARFKDVWKSQELQDLLWKFNAHGCERCPFNEKNRVLNYLLDPNPPHVNFV